LLTTLSTFFCFLVVLLAPMAIGPLDDDDDAPLDDDAALRFWAAARAVSSALGCSPRASGRVMVSSGMLERAIVSKHCGVGV